VKQGSFVASHGQLNRFRNCANLHNVNMSGEVVSADILAAKEFLNLFGKITEKRRYLPEHMFNVTRDKFILEKNA
jgi:hypothetical protein